jgi:hypothetical protein
MPPNKSLKPNAYRSDFQPHYASKGFGKCISLCWPGIGLAQALGPRFEAGWFQSPFRMLSKLPKLAAMFWATIMIGWTPARRPNLYPPRNSRSSNSHFRACDSQAW